MESINSIFLKNSFAGYPNKTQKITKESCKDIFENQNKKEDKTSQYLDILYSDTIEDTNSATNLTDLLKTYLPIKSQNLHFSKFFL